MIYIHKRSRKESMSSEHCLSASSPTTMLHCFLLLLYNVNCFNQQQTYCHCHHLLSEPQTHQTPSILNSNQSTRESTLNITTSGWRVVSSVLAALNTLPCRHCCELGCMIVNIKILCVLYVCLFLCCSGCENKSPSRMTLNPQSATGHNHTTWICVYIPQYAGF